MRFFISAAVGQKLKRALFKPLVPDGQPVGVPIENLQLVATADAFLFGSCVDVTWSAGKSKELARKRTPKCVSGAAHAWKSCFGCFLRLTRQECWIRIDRAIGQ